MDIKVHRLTDQEIVTLQQQLEQETARRSVEKRREALLAAQASAEKYGYDLLDLVYEFKVPKPKKRKAPAVKYRDPEDDTRTWTGMGRKPIWLVGQLEQGKTLEDFRIQ